MQLVGGGYIDIYGTEDNNEGMNGASPVPRAASDTTFICPCRREESSACMPKGCQVGDVSISVAGAAALIRAPRANGVLFF